LLARTRSLIGTAFETWILLKPGSATYTNGVFDLTFTSLTGTNRTFRTQRQQVAEPLDSGRLYLMNTGNTRALKMVPLIRLIAGEKTGQDTVYFYNRRVPGAIRWVSYHSPAEPELILADQDVDEFLSDLCVPHDDVPSVPPRAGHEEATQP
jgi:hypothetical protein